MRHLIFMAIFMTIPAAWAQEEASCLTALQRSTIAAYRAQAQEAMPCAQAIMDAATDFAPSLSGGRCTKFIAEEGSIKPYPPIPGAYSVYIHTENGSCTNNIWVKVDPNTCRVEGVNVF